MGWVSGSQVPMGWVSGSQVRQPGVGVRQSSDSHGCPTVTLKGSSAVLQERPSTQKYPYAAQLRQQLIDEGVLVPTEKQLDFEKDYEFSSPSAAASVIHGGQANGLTAWISVDGVSLKHREESEASNK